MTSSAASGRSWSRSSLSPRRRPSAAPRRRSAVLVAARALQGVAGAMLAPAALGTLVTTFREPRDRGKAFGVFGTVAVGGGAVGLILGGILTEYLSWRWCMYVNVLFAAAAFVGAVIYMSEIEAAGSAAHRLRSAPCWPRSGCSASCSASPRPRPTAGARA